MKELKDLQELVKQIESLTAPMRISGMLIEMAYEENDESIVPEIKSEIWSSLRKHLRNCRIQTLLSGEYDPCNAIVTIHAGAGGTESCDWARYAVPDVHPLGGARKGFHIQVLDYPGRGYRRDQGRDL